MFKKISVFITIISMCSILIHCPWDKKKDDSDLTNIAALIALAGAPGIQFSAYAGTQKLECGQTLRGHARSSENLPNAHIAESTTFQLHDFRFCSRSYIDSKLGRRNPSLSKSGRKIPIRRYRSFGFRKQNRQV